MAADSSSSMSGFQPEAVGAGDGAKDGGAVFVGGQGGGGGSAGGGRGQEDEGDVLAVRRWPVPYGVQPTGEYLWQCHMGGGRWRDVDPTWNEALFLSWRDGVSRIRLVLTWYNRRNEAMHEWYTIDFTRPHEWITQEHERTGVLRTLRAVQWVIPTGTSMPRPPPSPTEWHVWQETTGPDERPIWL